MLLQAKLHERFPDHLGQLCGAMRAYRDVLRRKVLFKRKYDSITSSTEEEQAVGNLKKVSCTSMSVFTTCDALLACSLLCSIFVYWVLFWHAILLCMSP